VAEGLSLCALTAFSLSRLPICFLLIPCNQSNPPPDNGRVAFLFGLTPDFFFYVPPRNRAVNATLPLFFHSVTNHDRSPNINLLQTVSLGGISLHSPSSSGITDGENSSPTTVCLTSSIFTDPFPIQICERFFSMPGRFPFPRFAFSPFPMFWRRIHGP